VFFGYQRAGAIQGTLSGAVWQRLAPDEIDNENVYYTELEVQGGKPGRFASRFRAAAPRSSGSNDRWLNEIMAKAKAIEVTREALNSFGTLLSQLTTGPKGSTFLMTDDPALLVRVDANGDFIDAYEPLMFGYSEFTREPPIHERTVWYRIAAIPMAGYTVPQAPPLPLSVAGNVPR
jgi:hypothetical protein